MSISELTESSIDYKKQFEEEEKELSFNLPPWDISSISQKFLTICLFIGIWFPVFVLISLVIISYTTYLVLYICPLLKEDGDTAELYYWHTEDEQFNARVRGSICLSFMTLFFLLFFVSYYQSVFTPPGEIPNSEDWKIPSDSSESDIYSEDQRQTRRDGTKRICNKCIKKKPDRAHHCKQCETCILKMDHHCNWIANCVGFYNYKFFFHMVLYGSLMILLFLATFWESVVVILNDNSNSTFLALWAVMIYTMLLLLGFALIVFTIFHIQLICMNMTTIEYCESSNKHDTKRSIFDKGALRNFKDVFGENVCLWFIPIQYRKSEKTGLYFY